MKILYLGNFLNYVNGRYDGPNVQVVKILQEQGNSVDYAGTSGNQLFRLMQFIKALIIARVKNTDLVLIDVFSTRAFYFAVLSGWLARILNIKYGLILHGGNLPQRFQDSRWISHSLLKAAALVSSPSGYLATAANANFEVKVDIIPNRIAVKILENNKPRKNQLFWVRSLSSIYNPEMAVEVLRLLKENNLDFDLIFIGPGDNDRINAVKGLVEKYNLDTQVHFKGSMERSEWHQLAKRGKYFLNTTYVDNTPSSVIEAMALGIVPISTNVGGLPFILEDGKDSFLINSNDAQSMFEAIKKLDENPELRINMERACQEKFAKFYHDSVIEKKWKEVLSSLN